MPRSSLRPLLSLLTSLLFWLSTPALTAAEDPVPFPDMAPAVGDQLTKHYYDPSRFHPRTLVERALRSLETSEISIDTVWAGDVIVLNIAGARQQIPAPEPKDLEAAMALIEAVRVRVDAADLSPLRRRELAYALINGALSSLDPHTVMFPPAPADDFIEDISGRFFGIGAYLTQDDGVIGIERVMPDFPADKAGVQDGDAILAVNAEKTAGLSLDQAVHRIKGPKGTTVVLTLKRKVGGQIVDVPVVRDEVSLVTMRSWADGDVGYVCMNAFNDLTAKDLYRFINELKRTGHFRAFVLDLRFNGGGLLEQARLISNFFLGKGQEIVRTVAVDGEPDISKSGGMAILDLPMVVLTSSGSASAAEILSGALQRNDRAVVMGATTYGKGSVQTVLNKFRDGSKLKVTIQEYQLPGGVSIQDVGVSPDVRLVRHLLRDDGGIHLAPFIGSREVDDEFALENHRSYEHQTAYTLGWLAQKTGKEEQKRSSLSTRDFQPDQEAKLAVSLLQEVLKHADFDARATAALKAGKARQFLLDELKEPLALRAETEATALGQAFAQLTPPIIWGAASAIAAGQLTATYTGPATVTAGTTAALAFSVANSGTTAVGHVHGVIRADRASPLWQSEVMVGEVPAGGSATGTLTFKVPLRSYQGEERFVLDLFHDDEATVLTSVPVTLAITALPRPHLSLEWALAEPSGDGVLAPGETGELTLKLRNDGDGASLPVMLYVFKADDPHVQLLSDGRFKFDALAPGAKPTEAKVQFTVQTEVKTGNGDPKPFTAGSITLQLTAEERLPEETDGRYRANFFSQLVIPIGKPVSSGELVQPLITVEKVDRLAPDKVAMSLTVRPRAGLKFITVFQNEDKISLDTGAVLADTERENVGRYTQTLTLKPGVNNVRVAVATANEVDEVLPLRLWGPDEPLSPVTPTIAKPEAKSRSPAAPEPALP